MKIVTLCGSTKLKDEFMEAAKEYTLQKCIVLMPNVFGHSGDVITDEQKEMLDDLHKVKIDMCDEVIVLRRDGYIGTSTASEIDYAKVNNKPVIFKEV